MDVRRAIRFVRSHAADFDVAPERIGMMGFSAGGHLTAMAGTMFEPGKADAADPVERASSRPDFIILGYPWLNAMTLNQKAFSYCSGLGIPEPECRAFEQYSPDRHVTKDTPPAFIYHTTDDGLVPVDASVSFYRALAAAGASAEMHLFRTPRRPLRRRDRRVSLVRQQQVRSLDVTPTILDYLGIPPARYPLLGRSLRDVVERDAPREEPSFAWIGNTVSDVHFPYKLVHDLRSGRTQLFDLRTDPHEKRDLGPESDRERARLLAEVRRWGGLDAPLEDDVKARLQALGYVE